MLKLTEVYTKLDLLTLVLGKPLGWEVPVKPSVQLWLVTNHPYSHPHLPLPSTM
jgi:hypothetical protein